MRRKSSIVGPTKFRASRERDPRGRGRKRVEGNRKIMYSVLLQNEREENAAGKRKHHFASTTSV